MLNPIEEKSKNPATVFCADCESKMTFMGHDKVARKVGGRWVPWKTQDVYWCTPCKKSRAAFTREVDNGVSR